MNPTNAVLAGLRLLEETLSPSSLLPAAHLPARIRDVLTNAGADEIPTPGAIDGLCEEINTGCLLFLTPAQHGALVSATEIAFDDTESVPAEMREAADAVYNLFHPPLPRDLREPQIKSFQTVREAAAFAQGIEYVNDSALRVELHAGPSGVGSVFIYDREETTGPIPTRAEGAGSRDAAYIAEYNARTTQEQRGWKRLTTDYFHGAPLATIKADPTRYQEGHQDVEWTPIKEGE